MLKLGALTLKYSTLYGATQSARRAISAGAVSFAKQASRPAMYRVWMGP